MNKVYLDYAATTPCDERVVKEMADYWNKNFANPSSIHQDGMRAKQCLEKNRAKIAELIGAQAKEIIFTSGGTEANNTALKSAAKANAGKGNHIISTAIEHPSVLESLKFLEKCGFEVTLLEVDPYGRVDLDKLTEAIRPQTILVSVMHANNEIGTIQPISGIVSTVKRIKEDILVHTDAVQSLGHIPVHVRKMGMDLLSASAHKFYGPKGVGLLYIKKGTKMTPLIHGGGQEGGKRASTENTPAIAGMRKALEINAQNMDKEAKETAKLRDLLKKKIKEHIPQVRFNGHPQYGLPNNLSMSVKYIDGEALALRLDLEGISCSTGSACSSEKGLPSQTLQAIGLSGEWIHGTIRFSLGKYTCLEDIDYCVAALTKVVQALRNLSPLGDVAHYRQHPVK